MYSMRSTLYFIILYIITINFEVSLAAGDETTTPKPDQTTAGEATWYGAVVGSIVALNVVSFTCIVLTLHNIREIQNDTLEVARSAMDGTQACIRAGLGPTARKAMLEAANGKPEFAKLQ